MENKIKEKQIRKVIYTENDSKFGFWLPWHSYFTTID